MIKILVCAALVLSRPALAQEPTVPQPPIPPAQPVLAPAELEKPAHVVRVRGKIKAITLPPKPRSVPYRDAVISIDLNDVQVLEGKVEPKEILVFAWGMRDNTWTAAAAYRAGQIIELTLQPWDDVAERSGIYNRIELEGEEIFQLEPFWGEIAPK